MVLKRKFCAYRRIERPYTRISKFREKSFVRARPHTSIARFNMGDLSGYYDHSVTLIVTQNLQIGDGAIESGRMTALRLLEKKLGKTGYRMDVRLYPHHILRENPLASGAGADRMSQGMAGAFGKVVGIAARCFTGQPVYTIFISKNNVDIAKEALTRSKNKIPCHCQIIVEKCVGPT